MTPRKHILLDCDDPFCDGCNLCELANCGVCGGAEGTLTTHCCGRRMTPVDNDLVYNKGWDYVDGKWVKTDEPIHARKPLIEKRDTNA